MGLGVGVGEREVAHTDRTTIVKSKIKGFIVNSVYHAC